VKGSGAVFPAPETNALHWFKSSRSAQNGACVEVAFTPDTVALRDSKDPSGPILQFGAEAWREFVGSVRSGTFDLPTSD
jgi:hypothetical protein